MKQEHQRIREIVKELGEKQFNDHTRPIRYTKGYDDILEYIEQQEIIERALTDTTLEIVKRKREELLAKKKDLAYERITTPSTVKRDLLYNQELLTVHQCDILLEIITEAEVK